MSPPKTACFDNYFFISVSGISHSTTQTFQFYNSNDQVQQEYIEAKQQRMEQPGYSIFSWDWTPETEKRNVWLSIECDEGGPIKLPLFKAVDKQEYQYRDENYEQNYHLQAVVPLTLLPSYQPQQYPEQYMAPVRNGYIYIFRGNQLWRELEIKNKEDSGAEFRDTHLYHHREGFDKPFKKGPRKAVGKPLKDIWLPTKANGSPQRLHIAYSEVQWSAAYLNFLEHPDNQAILQQRTSLITHRSINVLGEKLNTTFRTMRLREPEIEQKLADPSRYNQDLSGNHLQHLYDGVSYEVDSLRNNSSSLLSTLENSTHQRLEYGARVAQYNRKMNNAGQEDSLWQARGSIDYLADARARQLKLMVLPDPLFELRHHTQMAMQVSACLFHILEDAGQQKYFQNAELVQRFVVPDTLPNGQENPNHKHLDSFNYSPIGVFQRTLRSIERRRCREDMALFQQTLGQTLDNPATAAVIRDITSLDYGASGAYVIVGNAMQALSQNLASIDPLQDKTQDTDWPGHDIISNFYTRGASHPLHALLYPPADQVPLDTAYTAPPPINDGSGLATTENIARWAGDNLLLSDNVEIMEHATLLAENDEDGFAGSRRILNTADGILSGFFTAMLALQNKASARASLSELVETIEFKPAYLNNIGLAKLIAPDSFGKATFTPTSGEPIPGAYVVGVHSQKTGLHFGLTEAQRQRTTSKRTGVFQDSNGQLLASTNKRSLKGTELRQGATARNKADFRVLMVPEDNLVTQMKVEQLAKEADLEDKLKPQSEAAKTAGKVYTKLGIPYFIVVLEIMNLQRTAAGFEGRSASYILTSGTSAFWDLGVAIVNASNVLTRETGLLAKASTATLRKLSPATVRFLSFPSLNLHLEGTISRLKFAGIVGGILTTAVAIWDTAILIGEQDKDAAFGMAMFATGTAISTFGSLYTATFLLSPLGWIGLAIALAGFSLYLLFKDSPMESWLTNGPFGKTPAKEGYYAYLQEPQQGYQSLLSLIMNIQIKTYPLHQVGIPADLRMRVEGLGATHAVWLSSNLLGIFDPDKVDIQLHAKAAVLENRFDTWDGHYGKVTRIDAQTSRPCYRHITGQGCLVFYRYSKTIVQPENTRFTRGDNLISYQPHFHCRAQLRVGNFIFPAPPPGKLHSAGAATAKPTFSEPEYWWADETDDSEQTIKL
ncbi:hypothetical protein [Amphritea pacifica]|uniref:Uncharacterized protein n=1 Tax=Amphritea pacifica TaxID=2811233 RepID=A0ABS2WDG0_9GAMM|nr:hypothetical protein [Amphritea pacifica]MBN0989709.1 hypothetical protein [Amphritea pacifica]